MHIMRSLQSAPGHPPTSRPSYDNIQLSSCSLTLVEIERYAFVVVVGGATEELHRHLVQGQQASGGFTVGVQKLSRTVSMSRPDRSTTKLRLTVQSLSDRPDEGNERSGFMAPHIRREECGAV
jgi:hypothetical protein